MGIGWYGIYYHGNWMRRDILPWESDEPGYITMGIGWDEISYHGNWMRRRYGHSNLLLLFAKGGRRFAPDRIHSSTIGIGRWRTETCVSVEVSLVTHSRNLQRWHYVDGNIRWNILTLVLAIVTNWGQPSKTVKVDSISRPIWNISWDHTWWSS